MRKLLINILVLPFVFSVTVYYWFNDPDNQKDSERWMKRNKQPVK